jgi:hypothetical protein
LITAFAIDAGVPRDTVTELASPVEGVKKALAEAKPGDCLVLLALTQRDELLALVREFVADK